MVVKKAIKMARMLECPFWPGGEYEGLLCHTAASRWIFSGRAGLKRWQRRPESAAGDDSAGSGALPPGRSR